MKYLVKRSGKNELLGKNLQDEGSVQSILGVENDILNELRKLLNVKENVQVAKAEALAKVKPKLDALKKFVGQKHFALGYLTLADFYLAEHLYMFEFLYPTEKKHYQFWWRIRHSFEELPGIKAYYKRPDAISEPFVPPIFPFTIKFHRVKLAYWGIRGLAQVPRLLLAFSGVHFEDYHYTNADTWFKNDKLHLGIDFPNLPYLIDGDNNVT